MRLGNLMSSTAIAALLSFNASAMEPSLSKIYPSEDFHDMRVLKENSVDQQLWDPLRTVVSNEDGQRLKMILDEAACKARERMLTSFIGALVAEGRWDLIDKVKDLTRDTGIFPDFRYLFDEIWQKLFGELCNPDDFERKCLGEEAFKRKCLGEEVFRSLLVFAVEIHRSTGLESQKIIHTLEDQHAKEAIKLRVYHELSCVGFRFRSNDCTEDIKRNMQIYEMDKYQIMKCISTIRNAVLIWDAKKTLLDYLFEILKNQAMAEANKWNNEWMSLADTIDTLVRSEDFHIASEIREYHR